MAHAGTHRGTQLGAGPGVTPADGRPADGSPAPAAATPHLAGRPSAGVTPGPAPSWVPRWVPAYATGAAAGPPVAAGPGLVRMGSSCHGPPSRSITRARSGRRL